MKDFGENLGKKQGEEKPGIVILGGGLGAVSAAYGLTLDPNWKEKYGSIRIYTMGWRLGGKGASSRNPDARQRIEEHGLHVWMGFYENAFKMIRACYEELERPANAQLPTWEDAFKKHSPIALAQSESQGWKFLENLFPENEELPGDGFELPSLWSYVEMLLEWVVQSFIDSESKYQFDFSLFKGCNRLSGKLAMASHRLQGITLRRAFQILKGFRETGLETALLHGYGALLATLHGMILRLLEYWGDWDDLDDELKNTLSLMNLAVVLARGIVSDDVFREGFDPLDRYDFRDWLKKHGLQDLDHPAVKGMYSLLFSYIDGDPEQAKLGAGVATRFLLRMGFTYKGSIFWKMQAGMGETVFSPIYEVLKKRGVTFHFFHRVTNLVVDPATQRISKVELTKQASLLNDSYQPLVDVHGLPCWPLTPHWDQLKDGDELRLLLKKHKVRFGSKWAPAWKDETPVELVYGKDYEQLVLGISLGALPPICQELSQHSVKWRDMLRGVRTNRIQALQLWMNKSLEELGWPFLPPVATNFAEPLNTYADMSHLSKQEEWLASDEMKHIAYFCGPMKIKGHPKPPQAHSYPYEQNQEVRDTSIAWLKEYGQYLWPTTLPDHQRKGFDWDCLVDLAHLQGEDRINSQYYHANVEPSDRYVLATPGTTSLRLDPENSYFRNLYLAGDWTMTGLNCGCVESTVMSGLRASRAICGFPSRIVGESDF